MCTWSSHQCSSNAVKIFSANAFHGVKENLFSLHQPSFSREKKDPFQPDSWHSAQKLIIIFPGTLLHPSDNEWKNSARASKWKFHPWRSVSSSEENLCYVRTKVSVNKDAFSPQCTPRTKTTATVMVAASFDVLSAPAKPVSYLPRHVLAAAYVFPIRVVWLAVPGSLVVAFDVQH